MGHAESYRADGRAPAIGRAPAEGLEDALACGKEGWYVLFPFPFPLSWMEEMTGVVVL